MDNKIMEISNYLKLGNYSDALKELFIIGYKKGKMTELAEHLLPEEAFKNSHPGLNNFIKAVNVEINQYEMNDDKEIVADGRSMAA